MVHPLLALGEVQADAIGELTGQEVRVGPGIEHEAGDGPADRAGDQGSVDPGAVGAGEGDREARQDLHRNPFLPDMSGPSAPRAMRTATVPVPRVLIDATDA